MDKQPIENPNPGADQAPESPAQQPANGAGESQYVTKEELAKFAQSQKEEIRRQAQSYSMQAEQRLNKRVGDNLLNMDNTIQAQQKAGANFTEDQIAKFRQQAVNSAMDAEVAELRGNPQQQPGTQQPAQQPANAYVNGNHDAERQRIIADVTTKAQGMMLMAGTTVEENDPEFAELSKHFQDPPEEFLSAFGESLKAKADRTKINPKGQLPNLIPGSSIPASNLQAKYDKEKSALTRGDTMGLTKINIRYRKLGLKV